MKGGSATLVTAYQPTATFLTAWLRLIVDFHMFAAEKNRAEGIMAAGFISARNITRITDGDMLVCVRVATTIGTLLNLSQIILIG
jgi:hypothetical protein